MHVTYCPVDREVVWGNTGMGPETRVAQIGKEYPNQEKVLLLRVSAMIFVDSSKPTYILNRDLRDRYFSKFEIQRELGLACASSRIGLFKHREVWKISIERCSPSRNSGMESGLAAPIWASLIDAGCATLIAERPNH